MKIAIPALAGMILMTMSSETGSHVSESRYGNPVFLVKSIGFISKSVHFGTVDTDSSFSQYTYDSRNRCVREIAGTYITGGISFSANDTIDIIYTPERMYRKWTSGETETYYLDPVSHLADSMRTTSSPGKGSFTENIVTYAYDENGYLAGLEKYSYDSSHVRTDTTRETYTVSGGNRVRSVYRHWRGGLLSADTTTYGFTDIPASKLANRVAGNTGNRMFGHSDRYLIKSDTVRSGGYRQNYSYNNKSYTFDNMDRLIRITGVGNTVSFITTYTYY